MKSQILSEVFAELCESQTHFDSLLSKVNPSQKSKVATLLGAFLRRPFSIAEHFKIQLAETPEDFWGLSFIKLKKHPGIHAALAELWEKWESAPNEGTIKDFPPQMIHKWEQDWGKEKAAGMARLLSQDPLTTIRFHRRAFSQGGELDPEVQAWLKSSELPKSRPGNFSERARVFRGFAAVQKNELFQKGFFEIQDEGSQVMSLFSLFPSEVVGLLSDSPQITKSKAPSISSQLFAKPLTVIDACAGAGGKTLALADLLEGKGRLYGYDLFEKKIQNLKKRMERAQERNVQGKTLPRESADELKRFRGTADVVLVDAPCSGLGVLRRNPDTKWNRKPMELKKRENERPLAEIQLEVLRKYSLLAKDTGRVVFGVCTLTKDESVDIVDQFLREDPSFEIEAQGYVGPFDTDGFYMCSLRKKTV
jgi:16S rRNA (cytosine967-C5)-methyltransferase